jgi:outer membrane protein OmpA-like peptidoglycan-associated protein
MWVVIIALASCQDLAGNPDQGSAGETAKAETVAGAYPSLHTVPPRPELSYPVKQRRAIVEGLIADRENARYTSAVVRYRSGLSNIPPPEEKPVAAVPLELAPEPQDDASAPSVAPIDRPDVNETPSLTYERDDLDTFMQDMLDSTGAARGEPQASASPRGPATPGARPSAGPVVAAGAGPQGRTQVVPATMPARPPAPASTSGTATAANENGHGAPPSPAPRRPGAAAAESGAGAAAVRTPVEKPAPETAMIDVAGGLVVVEVAPDDDPEMALVSVAFGPGSAALPPDEQARLERLLGEAKARGARVRIVGEAAAPALALDRARAVGLALVQGGLPADRLEMTLAQDGAGDRARLFLAAP